MIAPRHRYDGYVGILLGLLAAFAPSYTEASTAEYACDEAAVEVRRGEGVNATAAARATYEEREYDVGCEHPGSATVGVRPDTAKLLFRGLSGQFVACVWEYGAGWKSVRGVGNDARGPPGSGDDGDSTIAPGRVGGGSGPWVDEATNVRQGGAVSQCRPGSCVSASGEMLTGGAITEAQLLDELGEWSNPESLARVLGGGWKGGFFGDPADAVAMAQRGPMGAVLQAPHAPGHMVVIEPRAGGFVVYDPLPGVTYEVDAAWIERWVAGGVFR